MFGFLSKEKKLLAAIENGDAAKAIYLISTGASVNARAENDGFTALMLAANECRYEGRGMLEVFEKLLQRGAEVDARSNEGHTALMLAKGRGLVAISLIKAGADIYATMNDGCRGLRGMAAFGSMLGDSFEGTYKVLRLTMDAICEGICLSKVMDVAQLILENHYSSIQFSHNGYDKVFSAILTALKKGANVNEAVVIASCDISSQAILEKDMTVSSVINMILNHDKIFSDDEDRYLDDEDRDSLRNLCSKDEHKYKTERYLVQLDMQRIREKLSKERNCPCTIVETQEVLESWGFLKHNDYWICNFDSLGKANEIIDREYNNLESKGYDIKSFKILTDTNIQKIGFHE
ncbi:MAG: ankyrin repeat domain-containing protein [Clostridiales bacterium]|nr:ankyrin repeat domain-containing protein [Clostridiales bacterium]